MSNQRLADYDAAQVSVIMGGSIMSGFADGTFVSAARNNQSFTRVAGADGENARSKTNDKSGIVTLTLLQTSRSNEILTGFLSADELNGAGTFPLLIKDNNGSTLCSAETAWVQKPADVSYSKEIETREWVIECAELVMFVAGNPTKT